MEELDLNGRNIMNGNTTPDPDQDGGIDLGESPPQGGASVGAPEPVQPPQPNYPTVMLRGGPQLQRIADHGVHKIHAKVISRHLPHGQEKHHRVELEIHKIKPQMKRGRPAPSQEEEDGSNIRHKMEQIGE
jgi:hypothetical protein